jgi:hypothetical protein
MVCVNIFGCNVSLYFLVGRTLPPKTGLPHPPLMLEHLQHHIISGQGDQREPNMSTRMILPGLSFGILFSPIGHAWWVLCQSRCQSCSIFTSTDFKTALPPRLYTVRVSFELPPFPSMAGGDMLLPKLCFLLLIFP